MTRQPPRKALELNPSGLGVVIGPTATKGHRRSFHHLLDEVRVLNTSQRVHTSCNSIYESMNGLQWLKRLDLSLIPWRACSCARKEPLRERKLLSHANVPGGHPVYPP